MCDPMIMISTLKYQHHSLHKLAPVIMWYWLLPSLVDFSPICCPMTLQIPSWRPVFNHPSNHYSERLVIICGYLACVKDVSACLMPTVVPPKLSSWFFSLFVKMYVLPFASIKAKLRDLSLNQTLLNYFYIASKSPLSNDCHPKYLSL